MNKNKFLKEVNKNIKDISLDESKAIIIEICKDISENNYYKVLYRIKNIENNPNILSDNIKKEVNEIYNDFKKVQSGDIVFKCYSVETGYYSAFGEEYDYHYYPTNEMNELLNRMYELIHKLIFSKNYKDTLNIVDLLLYSDYTCEEISDPEYSDSDEVIDTFDMDIFALQDNLDFYINTVILYAIYAIIMGDIEEKYKKIDSYINDRNIDIRECQNLGIEEVSNLDKIYDDWLKYKKINKK
jgi:hypothetical protein